MLDLSAPGSNLEVFDGTLDVETLRGNLTQDGGILAPGDSPGTTDITGDYNFNSGTLEIELAGLTQGLEYDFVDVLGLTTLGTPAELSVSFLDGFENDILQTDVFTILNSDAGLAGTFAGLQDGATLTTADGLGRFTVNYDGNSVTLGNFSSIPEPSFVMALLFGFCFVVGPHQKKANQLATAGPPLFELGQPRLHVLFGTHRRTRDSRIVNSGEGPSFLDRVR